jgi:PKD repeat protein
MQADGSIGVYQDLPAGCSSLEGSDLTRLTIEGTGTSVPGVENVMIRGHIAEPSLNSPPVAAAGGPYSGGEGAGIQFSSAGSSDPDRDVLSYRWEFGDGATSTAANPKKAYIDNRTYAVMFTVTDPRAP